MKTVKQILGRKGSDVWSISHRSTVYEALQLMADKNIGSVLVLEADGSLVGIFTERDYARKVILKGKSSKETSVSELMSRDVLYVDPDKTVEDCMVIMTQKRIRHLPVIKNDRVHGIVSIGDVVNAIIAEQKSTIQELAKYITGSGY